MSFTHLCWSYLWNALQIEQLVSGDQVEPNTLNRKEEEEVKAPESHPMGFDKFRRPRLRLELAPRVKHPYSNQAVEAIRILHELAEEAKDVEFYHRYVPAIRT